MATSAVGESVGGGIRGNGSDGPFGHGRNGNHADGVAQRVYVTGMLIALGGILMFFAALVSSWVVRKGLSNGDWQNFPLPRILWLNTAVLLASSATLARSRRYLAAQRERDFQHWWKVTAILGAFFLAGQLIAWRQLIARGFFVATNPASSFFYVFTAAHGLHIVGGIAALLAVATYEPQRLKLETATKVVALYWHFLSALWLLIFGLLIWGG